MCGRVGGIRGALLVFGLLIASVSSAVATDLRNVITDLTITSSTEKDGLPPATITALAQDRDGYLWVGTRQGLEREAEGVTILTVFMDDETSSSVPWVVGEDHDRFVRTEQGWRFKSRQWKQLFARPKAQGD